ncbi:cytochrome P450 71A1-like protein [Tanacetum coccineum]
MLLVVTATVTSGGSGGSSEGVAAGVMEVGDVVVECVVRRWWWMEPKRDPESYESPEEFLPERFLGSDIDFKGNDFKFIPFGAGRRMCPGILMGTITVDLLLANLLYLFDWGLLDGMQREDIDFEVMPGITLHKKNELYLLPHVYL